MDMVWLWLWCRPAAAALIHLLAWERPHGVGVALRKRKKKANQTSRGKESVLSSVCEDAKPALTEIIPAVDTSAVQGQCPVFSRPEMMALLSPIRQAALLVLASDFWTVCIHICLPAVEAVHLVAGTLCIT